MISAKPDPFSMSEDFRSFAYREILLAWETRRVLINPTTYAKQVLDKEVGLYVSKLRKLSDLQSIKKQDMPKEYLAFYCQGRGYESLFKRLRDIVAHGDYGSPKRGWVQIQHRFKGPRDKQKQTRAIGQLKISTLRNLVRFLDESGSK